MERISVIVPCYNVEKVLPRCVDSLLAQTRQLHEIILVNDGSTDNTGEVARAYEEKYPNIRLVTKANGGLPQARRTGISEATGELIGFVDSDDWVEPDMYSRLATAMEKAQADIAVCGLYKSYEDGKAAVEPQALEDGTVLDAKQAFHCLHCRKDVFPYMWNKLFRRELFEDIQFPEGNFTGEDYVTLVQLLPKARRIVTVKAPLYRYWQASVSMSHGGFKPSHLLSYRYYREAAQKLTAQTPQFAQDIHSFMAVEYMAYVIAMSRNGNYNMELLKEVQKYVRSNLLTIVKNGDCSVLHRGSALAFSVHHKLLTTVYHILQR